VAALAARGAERTDARDGAVGGRAPSAEEHRQHHESAVHGAGRELVPVLRQRIDEPRAVDGSFGGVVEDVDPDEPREDVTDHLLAHRYRLTIM
jgi:hypothetical protein